VLTPQDALRADEQARAAGGVILSSAAPPQIELTPDEMIRLATARLQEQEHAMQNANVIMQTLGSIVAAMTTMIAEAMPDFETPEDGVFGLRLKNDLLERVNGANVQYQKVDEDLTIQIVLPESMERFEAAYPKEEQSEAQEGA